MAKHWSLVGNAPVIPGTVRYKIGKATIRPSKAPVEPVRGPVYAG